MKAEQSVHYRSREVCLSMKVLKKKKHVQHLQIQRQIDFYCTHAIREWVVTWHKWKKVVVVRAVCTDGQLHRTWGELSPAVLDTHIHLLLCLALRLLFKTRPKMSRLFSVFPCKVQSENYIHFRTYILCQWLYWFLLVVSLLNILTSLRFLPRRNVSKSNCKTFLPPS